MAKSEAAKKDEPAKSGEAPVETLVARLTREDLERLLLDSLAQRKPVCRSEITAALPEAKRRAKIARPEVAVGELRGEMVGPFKRLSLELHLRILAGSSARTIMHVLCTCSGLRSLSHQPALWRSLHLSTYAQGGGLPKHALRFIVPYLTRLQMRPHVRELRLRGDWDDQKDLKEMIKAFTEVENVTLGDQKVTNDVLKTAAVHWRKLRRVSFHTKTTTDLQAKLNLIAANHNIVAIELDHARLSADMVQRLALATLRGGASSILQRLRIDSGYDNITINESQPVWNCLGNLLPELTHLSVCLKIKWDEKPISEPERIPQIERLESLQMTISPINRWGGDAALENVSPSFLVPPDPTGMIEGLMAWLLPACPRLKTLMVEYRRDYCSMKDLRAGMKRTPEPTRPSVRQWAAQLERVEFTGAWAEQPSKA